MMEEQSQQISILLSIGESTKSYKEGGGVEEQSRQITGQEKIISCLGESTMSIHGGGMEEQSQQNEY